MQNIEIDNSENIICPYCNAVLADKEEPEGFEVCEHTIFVATDHGFEFVREDYQAIINDENRIQKKQNYDTYTSNLEIEGIRIADYVPAPSFMGAYWGFVK